MENTEERLAMLNTIPEPAFLVQDGKIIALNEPACQRQLKVGDDVVPMLATGQEEYENYHGGSLYLTMNICGTNQSVCISPAGENQLFLLEQEQDAAELQSMALIAKTMRTPLSNVMSVADGLFPMRSLDGDPITQEQIAKINKGLYQMLRIVCNMSDAYRYATEQAPRTELRDIARLIQEQFTESTHLIETSGIKVHYTGPKEAVYGIVDAEKLERAVANILSNAVKFTPVNGSVHAMLTRKGKMLYLTVQDSGSGVASHMKGNIYTSYRRQPGIEDPRFGLGLGMVLIRQAAAAHGGTVLMEHGVDFGLRLTMTLAICQPTDTNVRSPMILMDYVGDRDHRLVELSDVLPYTLYNPDNIG